MDEYAFMASTQVVLSKARNKRHQPVPARAGQPAMVHGLILGC
jgi:hypothetical protein